MQFISTMSTGRRRIGTIHLSNHGNAGFAKGVDKSSTTQSALTGHQPSTVHLAGATKVETKGSESL
jgi:hypothetical protein